jgi:hypothetical protein
MAKNPEPVVLELAPLPREQIGPFLLLGLEKDANAEQIEASWARRVIQARRQQIKIALEDVNWAREVINDFGKRVRADAGSFNLDTADGVLRQLLKRFGGEPGTTTWQPRDHEKDLREYTPAAEVPETGSVRAAIAVPETAEEVPFVPQLLKEVAQAALACDPWAMTLPTDHAPEQGEPH